MSQQIETWLLRFDLDGSIRAHMAAVVADLPQFVRDDLMDDPSFILCDYEPGAARDIPVRLTGLSPGRSVELKRTLRHRPVAFVRYVIAHELAHAHLRNAGRWPHEDPESAADELAAQWGFPKP